MTNAPSKCMQATRASELSPKGPGATPHQPPSRGQHPQRLDNGQLAHTPHTRVVGMQASRSQ
eukprot:5002593-Alexandrium_andersonii.AAC.1